MYEILFQKKKISCAFSRNLTDPSNILSCYADHFDIRFKIFYRTGISQSTFGKTKNLSKISVIIRCRIRTIQQLPAPNVPSHFEAFHQV